MTCLSPDPYLLQLLLMFHDSQITYYIDIEH